MGEQSQGIEAGGGGGGSGYYGGGGGGAAGGSGGGGGGGGGSSFVDSGLTITVPAIFPPSTNAGNGLVFIRFVP